MLRKIRVSDYLVRINNGNKIFAYNRLIGNFTVLDETENDVIKSIENDEFWFENNILEDKKKIINNLLAKQFIVIDDYDERKAILDGLDKYLLDVKKGKRIRKLLLEVTEKCNLSCKYCYIPHSRNLADNIMSYETGKEAIDKFFSIVTEQGAQDEVHIRFFGGEPLLEYDLIKKLCEYINQFYKNNLNILYYINTNALLLNKEMIEFFKSNKFKIGISMDGPKIVHDRYRVFKNNSGSYELVINKIKLLVNEGYPKEDIELYVTLSDASIGYIRQTIIECKNLNLTNLEIEILHDFEGKYNVPCEQKILAIGDAIKYGNENGVKVSGKWLKLYNRLKKTSLNYCGRQAEQIAVNPKGEIFVCSGLKVKFAELNSIEQLFNNEAYIDLTSRISGNIKHCNKCEIEGMCSGGCTGISKALFKNACSCEINECEFRRNLVKKLILNEVPFDFFESESYQPTTQKYLLDYSDYYKNYIKNALI